jgi:hypothetical protein
VISLESILQAVGSVGFPVAVATYLLVRIEVKLADLTMGIVRLTEAIADIKRVS